MSLVESIRMALRSLRANKMRSGLTMLGIIIGTGAVIALLSVGQGVQAAITALTRYAQPENFPGLHGPIGMGFGYPAAKALARLAGRTTHPEVKRLLAEENVWLRTGALAGLREVAQSLQSDRRPSERVAAALAGLIGGEGRPA